MRYIWKHIYWCDPEDQSEPMIYFSIHLFAFAVAIACFFYLHWAAGLVTTALVIVIFDGAMGQIRWKEEKALKEYQKARDDEFRNYVEMGIRSLELMLKNAAMRKDTR